MKFLSKYRQYLGDFLSLLYPVVCQGCGNSLFSHENLVCNQCLTSLPYTHFHRQTASEMHKVFWGRVELSGAGAMVYYEKSGRVQNLMHALKYRNKPEVGLKLGKIYGEILNKDKAFQDVDLLIPVPLHTDKLAQRGYNQSERIAVGMGMAMGKPVQSEVLRRARYNETQTRKSRFQRWENVQELFTVENSESLKGLHILLIDDVVTTGATLESCASELLKFNGVKLSIACLAYARHS